MLFFILGFLSKSRTRNIQSYKSDWWPNVWLFLWFFFRLEEIHDLKGHSYSLKFEKNYCLKKIGLQQTVFHISQNQFHECLWLYLSHSFIFVKRFLLFLVQYYAAMRCYETHEVGRICVERCRLYLIRSQTQCTWQGLGSSRADRDHNTRLCSHVT